MKAAQITRTLNLDVPLLRLYPGTYAQVVVTRPGEEPSILIEITHNKDGTLAIKHDKPELIPACVSEFDDGLFRGK